MTTLPPELAAFSTLLDRQPAPLRDAFGYCLAIAMVRSRFARLVETTRGETGPMCTFETITGERFSLTRPPMSKKMEAEVMEAARQLLEKRV